MPVAPETKSGLKAVWRGLVAKIKKPLGETEKGDKLGLKKTTGAGKAKEEALAALEGE